MLRWTPPSAESKCDYAMEEDGMIDEHVREVHNIAGIETMKPVQRIEGDTTILLLSIAAISTLYLLWASCRYGKNILDNWPARTSLGHIMGMSYLTIRSLALVTLNRV